MKKIRYTLRLLNRKPVPLVVRDLDLDLVSGSRSDDIHRHRAQPRLKAVNNRFLGFEEESVYVAVKRASEDGLLMCLSGGLLPSTERLL